MLAVLLGFVVLLPILHEPTLPLDRAEGTVVLDDLLARRFSRPRLELLDVPRMCHRTVVPFRQ